MGKIFIVLDLGHGDAGKGTMTDYCARQLNSPTIIKFNGGPQAAHNVVLPDGRHHTFAQFGSGTFIPGVTSYLAGEVLINPFSLLKENEFLQSNGVNDAMERLTISGDCTIITPFQKMLGQIKEICRGNDKYGSCGQGIGEGIIDREAGLCLQTHNLFDKERLRRNLLQIMERNVTESQKWLKEHKNEQAETTFNYFMNEYPIDFLLEYYEAFAKSQVTFDLNNKIIQKIILKNDLIFEGAQGALLDRNFGFYPYVTKSNVTAKYPLSLIKQYAPSRLNEVKQVGVIRPYAHRHGPGPLPTEDNQLESIFNDEYNTDNPWQGKFRVGFFDLVLARYALKINSGIDFIAVTHMDQLAMAPKHRICTSYQAPVSAFHCNHLFSIQPCFDDLIWKINELLMPTESNWLDSYPGIILNNCQPKDIIELPGWIEMADKKTEKLIDLPINAQNFLEFLSGQEGLNKPIKYLSFGKTFQDKIEI